MKGKSLLIHMTPIIRNGHEERDRIKKIVDDNNFEHELFVIVFTCTNYKLGYENFDNLHFLTILVDPVSKQTPLGGDNNYSEGTYDIPIMEKLNELYNFDLLDS